MPLVLQSIMTPITLIESPLFQIFMLGKDVPRPFPKPSPFGDLFPAAPEPEPEPEPAAEAGRRPQLSQQKAAKGLAASGLTASEAALKRSAGGSAKKTAAGKKKEKQAAEKQAAEEEHQSTEEDNPSHESESEQMVD